MAFANGITTFYLPTPTNAGSSQWGSDVRELLDSQDTGSNASTITSHGTGGNTVRTLDPYTTSTADSTEADYGWAVTPSDMNSGSLQKRVIYAGDHTCTFRTADQNLLGTNNVRLDMYAFRVGPAPGRTRTQLGTASTTYNLPLAGAATTVNVTVNLPEIVFDEDETIQYSWEFRAPGVIVTGHLVDHYMGTQGGTAIRVDHPGLYTIIEIEGSSDGGSTAEAEVANIKAANGSADGSSTATADVGGVAGAAGSASGTSTATAEVGGIAGAEGVSSGDSDATALVAVVKPTVGTVDIGAGGGSEPGMSRSRVVNK